VAYQPVVRNGDTAVKATALVGMHTVILGFDFLGSKQDRAKLLGFAVHRRDVTRNEAWWLPGQIRFRNMTGDHGGDVATNVAPLQKFRWGDYTAHPGHDYVYSVFPVSGTPAAPQLGAAVKLAVTTADNGPNETGIYFNRGLTATPAYLRRFSDVAPAKAGDNAYRWLTRGLQEALLDFIGAAQRGDELKVAIYEFEHDSVVAALKKAKAAGVRISVVYHAKPGDKQTAENTRKVKEVGLAASRVFRRRNVGNISHNKFVVHLSDGKPRRVWTGSTNFTEAGFFLQTNVGLLFADEAVARAFDGYWEVLKDDPEPADAKQRVGALLQGAPLPAGLRMFFSPVTGELLLKEAAGLLKGARSAVFISSPFGLDRTVLDALNENDTKVLEFGLVNITQKKMIGLIDRSVNTIYAYPAYLKSYDGRHWDPKAYGQHKIHVKAMVADPWGPTPRVLIGSANFSDESVNQNDENAFLVDADPRAAAVTATEFLRVFEHYKFRSYITRTAAATKAAAKQRYLAEDGSWTADYYDPDHEKYRDRVVFAG
jgi:phosphatidylserine/phosphatidylglycerophosphate/cardiolipin synthase-like enzyme